MPDGFSEPPINSYFLFEVDGVEIGYFTEVSGLAVTMTVEEIHEGGQNGYVHQMPGRMTWPHLLFKRGITSSDALFAWMNKSSGEGLRRQRQQADPQHRRGDRARCRGDPAAGLGVRRGVPGALERAGVQREQQRGAAGTARGRPHGFRSKNL